METYEQGLKQFLHFQRLRRPVPDRGGAVGVPSLRHRALVAMQIHFNDAHKLLTSGSDTLKRMLQLKRPALITAASLAVALHCSGGLLVAGTKWPSCCQRARQL